MQTSRRRFIQLGAATASMAALGGTSLAQSAGGEKIRFAQIGCGGRGKAHFRMWRGQEFVAAVDTNRKTVGMFNKQRFPDLKTYSDYREMYAENMDRIDAVIVATPDHSHFPAAMAALAAGKAVYCEKPLAWSMDECFALARMAKKMKVPTQMGNQGNAKQGWRDCYSMIKNGVIGDVKEVHTWTNRPVWPQGRRRPERQNPVPDTLDWESWIGPATIVPYVAKWNDLSNDYLWNNVYTPGSWRGWYDFGCGALGDMACHTTNAMFQIMKPDYDCTVEPLKVIDATDVMFPNKEIIKWSFAKKNECPGFDAYWYDGNLKPQKAEALGDNSLPGTGTMFVGTKGALISEGDYNDKNTVYVDGKIVTPEVESLLPPAGGDIHKDFIKAARGEKGWGDTVSNFIYAGKMTAIINMGPIAQKLGRKIAFSSATMKFDDPDANALMQRSDVRAGWKDAYRL